MTNTPTTEPLSKFEEIIQDVDAFRMMLDGAFMGWHGSYDVWLVDQERYLFDSAETSDDFRPFCHRLRQTSKGDKLCCDNDHRIVKQIQAQSIQHAHVYSCHAGLTDVAVPIWIHQELVAVVFCGQVMTDHKNQFSTIERRAGDLETEAYIRKGELVALVNDIPYVDQDTLRATYDRIEQLVNYISALGAERMKYKRAMRGEQQRYQATLCMQKANSLLMNDLTMSWEEFWQHATNLLDEMSDIIGAICGVVLMPRTGRFKGQYAITATAKLDPAKFIAQSHVLSDRVMTDVIEQQQTLLLNKTDLEGDTNPGPIQRSIQANAPDIAPQIDKAVAVYIPLNDNTAGVLAFFLNEEQDIAHGGMPIEEERVVLEQLAHAIGVAFHNLQTYQRRQKLVGKYHQWLENVTHQLSSPINMLRGHVENFQRWMQKPENLDLFDTWNAQQIEKLEKSLNAISSAAQHAMYMTNNLSQMVFDARDYFPSDYEVIGDMPSYLINIARDYQGTAAGRRIARLHVDTDTVRLLNNRVRALKVDRLFSQVIANMLDNAIKYSYPETEVVIAARMVNGRGQITITNEGIRIYEGEEEIIFERDHRAEEAEKVNAVGSGIGLYVARQIVTLHEGALTVQPSQEGAKRYDTHGQPVQGWLTTFVLDLPLVK